MNFFEDLASLRRLSQKEDAKLNLKNLVKIYRVFGRHYRKYWKALALAALGLIAAILVSLMVPWPLKLVLDHLILKNPFPEAFAFLEPLRQSDPQFLLLLLSLAIVLLAVLESLFSYVNKYWVSSTGERMVADIRERVFAHLQRLSLSFHQTARSGSLIYNLTTDVKEMKALLIDFPQDFTQRMGTFAAYSGLMLLIDWRLGLIALSTAPLLYYFTRFFGAGLKKAMKKKRKKESSVAAVIAENMALVALIQAYGQEESERGRFNSKNQGSLQAQLQALRLQKTFTRIADFLLTLSTAGVLYFGGRYALGGDLQPGTLVVFVAYLRDIYGSVEQLSDLFLNLIKAQVSGERLVELVENDMVMEDPPGALPAPPFRGHIEFRNVSFAYRQGHDVLKNLNFVVEPGETIALVGHSGAGKSTLISLLLRFYDPREGQILIDGQDLRRFTLKSLRAQITILMQDAKLFRQSVAENIAFGRPEAGEAEIIAAAKQAEAHEFICQMPEGYHTLMQEGGENLSGGQRQRINIARAIIRNTPIVILDEPLSGMDAKAEAQVNQALRNLIRGKTTFIIAHRFSTIAGADRILLLEEGQLAHVGTHQELLRQSPRYREFYELQFGHAPRPAGDEKAYREISGVESEKL